MPSESPADVKFEIGHVLFFDIVGYSKLLISEQSEQIQTLKQIVRGTEQFRTAEAEGKLLRLPTGDGGALVFRDSPEAPVLCALEISKALKSHPELRVRMGIHSGPVNEVTDLNEQANIAGAGINIAQRVMDCGDAGHILLSKRVADDLEHYPHWQPHLHSLGECEVKHGVRIGVVNLYRNSIGNPQAPNKFKALEQRRTRARWTAIAAALLFLAGIIAAFIVVSKKSAMPTSTVLGKSIAVLPFVNMSADKNDEYLSDGMTEELINVLAKVPGLRVPGRTSCFAFKGKNEEDIFHKVGDELHVGTVLEGSVRKAGEKLRVTAQLVNVADGYHLWSKDYDGDLKDILNFQSNVAAQVVQALQVKLGIDQTRALAKKPTENPEAHRLYLLGRYHVDKFTEADVTSAVDYFNQALQLDPGFALAYCGLADTYGAKGGNAIPSREAWAKQKLFAQKALALDPDLSEAHLSLGIALAGSFDWAGAKNELNRALELNPNLASAYDASAWFLTIFGRFDEAVEKEKKALELDPLNLSLNDGLGWYLYWAGSYDQAMRQLRNSIELYPNGAFSHFVLGWCLLKKGNAAEATAELQKATKADDLPWYIGWLGYAYAVSGDRAKAGQILHELDELAKGRYVTPGARVPVYLGLGDKEKTLDWLEKCYEEQDGACWQLKIDQRYDGLRKEPRFQAASEYLGHNSLREALVGNSASAEEDAHSAVAEVNGKHGEGFSAIALALAGDSANASRLADDLGKRLPQDSIIQFEYLPMIRAALALESGNAAVALQALEVSAPYELGHTNDDFTFAMYPVYLRGEADLAAKKGPEAASEFQKILDNLSIVGNEPIGALAYLGLGRAHGLTGDSAKAKSAYQHFFDLWKNADRDLPVLKQARLEYAKLP